MTQRRSAGARLRAGAALVPALALATTGMVAASAGAVTAAPAPVQPVQGAAASEAWINYVQPRAEKAFGTDKKVGKKDGAKQHDAIAKAMEVDRKHPKGNPVAARQLAKLEARAIKTGQNPKQIKSQYKGAKATQQARLLTILVEFNENANDDFSGAMVPSEYGSDTCVPG
ncbi:MAG TPA: protease, partial [Ornithinibacter sp.]|nr:protease [Ornithinibacter sp.]